MDDMSRILESQERETRERRHRRAEGKRCDAAGVLGLLPEQKITAVIRMLAHGSSADQMDEIARMGKSLKVT
ncbi:unnamed protein product [Prunus armeniaca]